MKECHHGLDADACELCQDQIKAAAARLGRSGGAARALALGWERRQEIARIAAQKRWHDVVWGGISAARKHRPRSEEHKEKLRALANERWANVATKRKAVEAALRRSVPPLSPETIASEVGCGAPYVRQIGLRIGVYQRLSEEERIQRVRAKFAGAKTNVIREILRREPHRSPTEIARHVGCNPPDVSRIRREMGLPALRRERPAPPPITDVDTPLLLKIKRMLSRGYRVSRVAQLLDLEVDVVKHYVDHIQAVGVVQPRASRRGPPLRGAELEEAVQMWVAGHSLKTIAQKTDRGLHAVTRALRNELRKRGLK